VKGEKRKACPEYLGKLDAGKLKFSTSSNRARVEMGDRRQTRIATPQIQRRFTPLMFNHLPPFTSSSMLAGVFPEVVFVRTDPSRMVGITPQRESVPMGNTVVSRVFHMDLDRLPIFARLRMKTDHPVVICV
jgi:hypothetical protein